MKKYILRLPLVLLFLMISQIVVGQNIIMGSAPLVSGIDDNPRHFFDPGGTPDDMGENQDPEGNFAQNLRDTMTLRINMSNAVVYINFDEFAMSEGDTLWIFDGPDCSSPLIGAFNLVNSPGELYASGKNMTFVFHSDQIDIIGLMSGWDAQVYAFDTLPANRLFGQDVFNITCNAFFFDSGGPNGNIASNNENPNGTTFSQFVSPTGSHIKCEFTDFSVNGVLMIYDGLYYDDNKRLIGQFCTSTLDNTTGNKPPVLFSSTNALSFVYKGSANDVNKSGWRAEITCVNELFDSPDGSACPSVTNTPSGAYADAPDPHVLNFDCNNPVILLEAGIIATGHYTSDYSVKAIPFESHIFEFTQGTSINASTDDNWLNAVNLPFTFIFFGKPYTTVWPGTNGLIAMDNHSGSCAYKYGVPPTSPPYTTTISDNQTLGGGSMTVPYNYKNCIYGVYEDIDCNYYNTYCYSTMGAVRVGVLGSYPCRAFVFNYLNVGLFGNHSSASNYNTYQMVIYEGTNIIDVYVKHRACCASTNPRGEGIIGIQNNTSSQILLAPGRGMSGWEADEEAWRFTPITPLDENGELTWYINSISDANIISYDPHAKNRRITVSPSETTKYISEYKYTNATGDLFVIRDTTLVKVEIPDVNATTSTGTNYICPNDNATLGVSFQNYPQIQPEHYVWSTGDTTATPVVSPSETSTYLVTVTFDNGCQKTDSVKVLVTDLELPEISGVDSICYGRSTTLTATHPSSNEFHWSTGQNTSTITVSPLVTTTYTVTAVMTGNCQVTDTFTVTVMPLPTPSFIANPTEIYVENGIGSVNCSSTSSGDYHLMWNFGDIFSNVNIVENVEELTHDYTHSGYYTITLTATDTFGCVDSIKVRVSVEVPYFFYIPNAFSPDGDGINETFAPQGQGVDPDHYQMQIFDRSGMLVFSTRNPYDYWDGRNKYGQMCPEGVYVYLIRLVNLNSDDKEYTGSVTLIR